MKTSTVKQFLHPHGWLIVERNSHEDRVAYTIKIDIEGDHRTFLATHISELTAIAKACMLTDSMLREHGLPAINWSRENI